MVFELNYNQLDSVAGDVRARIVSYDRNKGEHRAILCKELPRFLGSVAAVHGATFPYHQLENMIETVNAKEIEVDFLVVAFDACSPITIAGIATRVSNFAVKWDKNNNLKIYPAQHGEDICVDAVAAKLFRQYTRSSTNPDGIGAGTWFMRGQMLRAMSNPHWVSTERDNEHKLDNLPIIGMMDKFGAVRGTKKDSAVLQLDGLTSNMQKRWGVNNIKKLALPADPLGLRPCLNNFLLHWASEDSTQQIVVTYTKLPSLLDDATTVVWAKIKSNGNLPEDEMLKEVLASLFSVGYAEISSPERGWGITKDKSIAGNDLSHIFGNPIPTSMHVHANNEPEIVQALLEMEAAQRKYGHDNMLSGVMNLENIRDPVATLGQALSKLTPVTGIDLDRDANKPYFDIAFDTLTNAGILPQRPTSIALSENDNRVLSLKAA